VQSHCQYRLVGLAQQFLISITLQRAATLSHARHDRCNDHASIDEELQYLPRTTYMLQHSPFSSTGNRIVTSLPSPRSLRNMVIVIVLHTRRKQSLVSLTQYAPSSNVPRVAPTTTTLRPTGTARRAHTGALSAIDLEAEYLIVPHRTETLSTNHDPPRTGHGSSQGTESRLQDLRCGRHARPHSQQYHQTTKQLRRHHSQSQ